MKSYSVSESAMLKVLLHAAKHPTSAVNGVLLGTAAGDSVQVADAVPVSHNFITLAPLMEAALSQLEAHAKEQAGAQPGLRIVGYYQANERLDDGDLGAGRRYADRIDAAYPQSVALLLDGVALQAALKQQQQGEGAAADPPLAQLLCKDGARGWVKVDGGRAGCPTQGIAARLVQLLEAGRHTQLADFEEHLEDLGRDWLNPALLQGPA